jgi:endoglucanase
MSKVFLLSFILLANISCDHRGMEITDGQKAINRNKNIGIGINMGNALEAPAEGEWGLYIEERYIDSIKKAGFSSVRLPICWTAHTQVSYPYRVDQVFMARVSEVVNWCLERDLTVVITMHHYNEFYEEPDNSLYLRRFLLIWEQVARHFINTGYERLIFEPLNEPHGNMSADKWNLLIPEMLRTIRAVDEERTLIIDAPEWGYHQAVTKLVIPKEERNIIVSVRYYLPYEFTHQGAHWAEGSEAWLGRTWTGTADEKNTVKNDLDLVRGWSETNEIPVTVGEWGSIIYCDDASRLAWTGFVRREIADHGFSSAYFDFGVFFRAYDLENDHWLDGFKEALVDE